MVVGIEEEIFVDLDLWFNIIKSWVVLIIISLN